MNSSEEDIIILLRKICALSLPQDFEATEDTNRQILLDKFKLSNKDLFDTVSNFLMAYDSHQFIISDYQLKMKAADLWKSQLKSFNLNLENASTELKTICKNKHINIDYELDKLLN